MKAAPPMLKTYALMSAALALTFGIAACGVNVPAPLPAPAPSPTPTSTQIAPQRIDPPPVVTEPTYDNFLDAPQTAGTWGYQDDPLEQYAYFGSGTVFKFMLICNKQTRQITLARANASLSRDSRVMEVATETTRRQLRAKPSGKDSQFISVSLAPNDALFDAMAITKGRFAVSVEGERTLYLPAWAEVTRVIEDCR